MDSYKVALFKNEVLLDSHETVAPSFVDDEFGIRFATLEMIMKVLEKYPNFSMDIINTMERMSYVEKPESE